MRMLIVKTHLVTSNGFTGAIEDQEPSRSSALIDTTDKPPFLSLGPRLGDAAGQMGLVRHVVAGARTPQTTLYTVRSGVLSRAVREEIRLCAGAGASL